MLLQVSGVAGQRERRADGREPRVRAAAQELSLLLEPAVAEVVRVGWG